MTDVDIDIDLDPSWDRAGIEDMISFALEHHTTGLLVTGPGIDVEAYRAPTTELMGCEVLDDGRTREDVASAQKSVTALLVAMAVERGLLALDDTVTAHLGAGWTSADRSDEARITIRHLMTMTSGLDDALEVVAEPGTVWKYNLGAAYHSVKRVLAAAAGTDLATIGREWLFDPLGLAETAWQVRPVPDDLPEAFRAMVCYPDGEPFEALVSTARDLVALGLALFDGVPGIPADRLGECWRSSTDRNPAYGLLWWLNGQDWHLAPRRPEPVDGWLVPDAPADLIGALGAFGRFLHLVPSRGIVVARLGGDPGDQPLASSHFGNELWCRLRAAERRPEENP